MDHSDTVTAIGGKDSVDNDTYFAILHAAEEIFADSGYDGSSLRSIGAKAEVTAAMVVYYFGSKKGLFEAIFLKRGRALSDERLKRMDELEARPQPPSLEDLIRAFLVPIFNMRSSGAGGIAFLQLHARMQSDPAAWVSEDLRASVYNEAMQRLADAIGRAVPDCDAKSVFWRIIFATGALSHAISGGTRIEQVSGGICDSNDIDEMLEQLIAFCVGGFTAPALPVKTPNTKER